MQPLQTHGQYTTQWVPPKSDRFTVYDAGDEAWARPLGLGTVEQCLVNLYDVRDERNDLVGYTRNDPVAHYRRHGYTLHVHCLDCDDYPTFHRKEDRGLPCEPKPFRHIEIRLVQLEVCGERFLSWHVPLQYGAQLMDAGFLACIGPDHRSRYVAELRQRFEERDWEYQMRSRNWKKVPTDVRSGSYMG